MTVSPEKLVTAHPLDFSDLVLVAPDRKIHMGVLATGCPLELAMDGTATATVSLVEQEPGQFADVFGDFFKDDAAGRPRLQAWNTLTLLDTIYVLREASRTPQGAWDLVFYDAASEWLKQRTGAFKVARGEKTRGEFVEMLAREADVQAWIPDRHDQNLITSLAPADQKTLAQGKPGKTGDSPILRAVDAARRAGFRGETLVNMVAISGRETGGTYDPTVQNLTYPDHSIGLWQINQLAHKGRYGTDRQLKDPLVNARAAKKLYDAAGYSPWKGASGSWRDNITTGMFKRARDAVEKAIDSGAASESGGTVDRAHIQRYEFARGKRETSWDASGRLASEVRSNRYAVFNTLVYANDPTLADDPTPYELREDADWVDTLAWTVTARQRIDEITVTGRLAALVPPGAAFAVKDEHLPTWGTWLARNFKRDLLDPACAVELSLGRPRPPLPEPASSVKQPRASSSSSESSGSVRDRVIAEARKTLSSVTHYNYYSKPGAMTADPTPPRGQRSDCSQWVRAIYLKAGAGDPGANTWEQSSKGKRTTKPRPGDLLISPAHHVELYIGDGKTIGHGSPPIDEWTVAGMKATYPDSAFYTYDFLDR